MMRDEAHDPFAIVGSSRSPVSNRPSDSRSIHSRPSGFSITATTVGSWKNRSMAGPSAVRISKEAAQGRIGVAAALDEVRRAVTVVDVGGMDLCVEQVAGRVGRDVALASLDPLARIIAAWPARFGGLHRLTVDDAAPGSASRLCATRIPATSTALIASSRPLLRIR
jgi:hypothetical protein